jgi:hypothetical protein
MFGFKKKDKLEEVLGALVSFGGDDAGFERLKRAAASFFGPSWQFSLEMYVLSLPSESRDKYLPQFRRAMRYAKAASLWLSAKRLLSGEDSFGPDVAAEAGDYAEYLPLFGTAGQRLLDELFAHFNLSLPSAAGRAPKPEPKPAPKPAPVSKPKPVPVPAPDMAAELEPAPEPAPESEPEPEPASEPIPDNPPKETEPDARPVPAAKPKAADWRVAAFDRVADFVSNAREVMSVMVVEKGYASLEEYPGYVLLRDAADYAISLGEKLPGAGVARRLALLRAELAGEITIEKSDEAG